MSAEAPFSALLSWLAAEGSTAGAAYESLRKRLVGLFSFWGSAFPDEGADETFLRVAVRLHAGEVVHTGSRIAYLRGVARFVFLEELRRRELDRAVLQRQPEQSPIEGAEAEGSQHGGCLQECLQELDPDTRALVLDYYAGEERERIDRRQWLAERLGIGLVPLRNRMQRLRQKLRACMNGCLGDSDRRERTLVQIATKPS